MCLCVISDRPARIEFPPHWQGQPSVLGDSLWRVRMHGIVFQTVSNSLKLSPILGGSLKLFSLKIFWCELITWLSSAPVIHDLAIWLLARNKSRFYFTFTLRPFRSFSVPFWSFSVPFRSFSVLFGLFRSFSVFRPTRSLQHIIYIAA